MFYYYSIKTIFYYNFISFSITHHNNKYFIVINTSISVNFIIFYNLHDKEVEEIMTKKYIK